MPIQSISTAALSMAAMPTRDSAAAGAGDNGSKAVAGMESAHSSRATSAERPTTSPTAGEVEEALEEVVKAVAPMTRNLQFSLDKDSGKTVVKVMDTETNEVIRQIPSEEVLAISKAVDKFKGLLLEQQA